MVGRTDELTICELAQLLDLLKKYLDNLIYYANEGQHDDEDPRDKEARERAMNYVSDCMCVIKNELEYRLENY